LFGGAKTPVATGLFLTPGDVKLNTHQTGGGSFPSSWEDMFRWEVNLHRFVVMRQKSE